MKHFFSFLLITISPFLLCAKVPYVPYEEAFYPNDCPYSDTGDLYKSFYEAYHNQNLEEENYLIPPLIHFIWLGSPLPEKMMKIIETWKKLHPTWTVKIWTDEDVPFFELQNREAFDKSINFGEKSDIFRYEILYLFGGIYADVDFECLQPFDSLHQSCEFYVGLHRDNQVIHNSIIGARRGHPIIKACIDNLRTSLADHDPYRIMRETGPYHLTKIFLSMASSCELGKTVVFPPTILYPFPNIFRDDMNNEEAKRQFVRPESIAIHYWSCSWMR